MAVIKTCCGCLSTGGGTLAVLFFHFIVYVTFTILLSIWIDDGKTLETLYGELVKTTEWSASCNTAQFNGTWKCVAVESVQSNLKWVAVGALVDSFVYLVAAVVALVGALKEHPRLLLPWIAAEFIRMVVQALAMVMAMVFWSAKPASNEDDSSLLMAMAMIGAAALALAFYLWLCVVSHFQMVREINGWMLDGKEPILPYVNGGDETASQNDTDIVDLENEDVKIVNSDELEELKDTASQNETDLVDLENEDVKIVNSDELEELKDEKESPMDDQEESVGLNSSGKNKE